MITRGKKIRLVHRRRATRRRVAVGGVEDVQAGRQRVRGDSAQSARRRGIAGLSPQLHSAHPAHPPLASGGDRHRRAAQSVLRDGARAVPG